MIRIRSLLALICFLSFYSAAIAGNIFWIKNSQIYALGKFDPWGCEIHNWNSLLTDEHLLKTQLRPLAANGINCIGLRLQDPDQRVHFFNFDGTPHNTEKAQRFTKLTGAIRNHYIGTVINLFSADPRCYLASADAYRQAVKTAAELLPHRHSAIFVLGDVFGTAQWQDTCPFPMNDPDHLIELARIINKANPKAMVAIPGKILNPTDTNALLFFSQKADALQTCFNAVKLAAKAFKAWPHRHLKLKFLVGDVAAFPVDQFLMRKNVHSPYLDDLSDFQEKARQTRLQKSFPPPTNPNNPKAKLSPEEKAQGFNLLFDGQSLDGWTTLTDNWGGWSVQNGTIYCNGTGNYAWLRSKRLYDNFILRLEFKILQNGNSGLFIRGPLDGRASRFGMEMQIFGKLNNPPNAHETSGAIYGIFPPKVDAANPPGQWNAVEVTCHGPQVSIRINEKTLSDINMDNIRPLQNSLQHGVIGLQDHSCKVWFRNIRIKELQ